MKKYNRRKKKNISKIVFFCLFFIIFIVYYYLYNELTHPKFAKEWTESRASVKSHITLPKDEAHHKSKMEWWYYNGHLVTESGDQFSFHFTTFLVNNLFTHTVFHSSLSDHLHNEHYIDQLRIGGNPSTGSINGFNFKHNNWLMSGNNGLDRIKVDNDQFGFDLTLNYTQAPINQGDNGILSLNSIGSSYYYSRARMNVSGVLTVKGNKQTVKGVSWFDHQWGNFSTVNLSWDWFSLQLDNRVDIMLYRIRNKEGGKILYMGNYTEKGKTVSLSDSDFIITPGKEWKSKSTGISYPINWTIKIPKKKIDIKIESLLNTSEFDAKLTTYNVYWEGAVKIEGSHTGKGFVELYGYK